MCRVSTDENAQPGQRASADVVVPQRRHRARIGVQPEVAPAERAELFQGGWMARITRRARNDAVARVS